MDGVRATATLSQHQALHNGDAFGYDQFDDHPFSYPYLISNLDSSSSSAVESPSLAQPAVSSVSPPSRRSSRTSWETSWFDDDDGDKLADVSPYGTDQCEMGDYDEDFDYDDEEYEMRDDSVLAGDDSESCNFNNSEWFRQYNGQLDVSDNAPNEDVLNTAGEIPVYDSAGGSRPFKSLFAQGDVVGDRQLIIFIRFFYCGVSTAWHALYRLTVTDHD